MELYNRWRRGAVLEQGSVVYDSDDEVWIKPVEWILEEQELTANEADTVTVLLNKALPANEGNIVRQV